MSQAMNRMTAQTLDPWHDLIERLWRDIDPAKLSGDFRDYTSARAAFEAYLAELPPGQDVPMYLDSPANLFGAKIERTSARILDRVPTCPIDIAEKALVVRDRVFHPRTLTVSAAELSAGDMADLARVFACVIEAAFPRPKN